MRSLGVGRWLQWGVINVGASGGVVIFWDSRTLQLMGIEELEVFGMIPDT